MTDRGREMNRLADLATNILYDDGALVHAMPYRAGSYDERTPLHARDPRRRHGPVKPETAAFLAKSRECLESADRIRNAGAMHTSLVPGKRGRRSAQCISTSFRRGIPSRMRW